VVATIILPQGEAGGRCRHERARLIAAAVMMALVSISTGAATPPKDPNLPHAKPEALEQLSETRIRQKIMLQSQAHYAGRCVCRYQTHDAKGRSCKGRHELVTAPPEPICYPQQVTPAMITQWKQRHGGR
jgi:hypothetical protein